MGINKEKDKQEILELVKEYTKNYLMPKEYEEGDYIPYSGRVFNEEEVLNLVDASLDFWLTSGPYTDRFEKEFGEYLDVPFVSLVNSGSSANLLAFATLTSPLLKERQLKKGDEIITVAASFPTTITPIIQCGCAPVFLDVTIPQYNIDVNQLEEALSNKTKAIFLAHTMGNPFDLKTIKDFCEKHQLWLIEDNCDALGSTYTMSGSTFKTGTIGDIGTSSFYPPHHITMGEGGAVYTKNPLLHKIIRSLRDWGRDCSCPPGQDNHCGHRFDGQYGLLPKGYDHKYTYSHFGYNMKATDMQAAIGCAQLQKLPDFVQKRKENFALLNQLLLDKKMDDYFILPKAVENGDPSWFGYLLTVKEEDKRNQIVQYLEKHGVQTRMLFAGNILYHPCFDQMREDKDAYRVIGDLSNTNQIMNQTFWVGVYPGMTKEKIYHMANTIEKAVQETL